MKDPHADFYKIYELDDESLRQLLKMVPEEVIYRASVTMPKIFLDRLANFISKDLKERILKQQSEHEPFILVSDINDAQFFIGGIISNIF